ESGRGDPICRDSAPGQIILDRSGTALGETLVVLRGSDRVGVAFERHFLIRVLFQESDQPIQYLRAVGLDRGLVEIEQDVIENNRPLRFRRRRWRRRRWRRNRLRRWRRRRWRRRRSRLRLFREDVSQRAAEQCAGCEADACACAFAQLSVSSDVRAACARTGASSAADEAGNYCVIRLTIESRTTGKKKYSRDNCRQTSLLHTHPLQWQTKVALEYPNMSQFVKGKNAKTSELLPPSFSATLGRQWPSGGHDARV